MNEIWERVVKSISSQVDLANEKKPEKCKVTQTQPFVSLVGKHGQACVFEYDARQRLITITFPPLVDQGNGRSGEFEITREQMIKKKKFVGTPEPPARPISPEEFSEIMLAPFFDEM